MKCTALKLRQYSISCGLWPGESRKRGCAKYSHLIRLLLIRLIRRFWEVETNTNGSYRRLEERIVPASMKCPFTYYPVCVPISVCRNDLQWLQYEWLWGSKPDGSRSATNSTYALTLNRDKTHQTIPWPANDSGCTFLFSPRKNLTEGTFAKFFQSRTWI